jgi:hypothetical protein
MDFFSRRDFIKTSAMGAAAAAGHWHTGNFFSGNPAPNELLTLAQTLSATWAKTLLQLQVTDSNSANYGTMIYPPENKVHGRMGDTFYPFLHFARNTKDNRYLDAAILLYRWMEKTVSQEDGSWLNEPVKNSWKGTTVFTSIALAEALKLHGDLLDNSFRQQIMDRLKKSGDYIFKNFSIDYGNVNYPVAGSYCLSLLGELLDSKSYTARGRELAHTALKFFTPKDHFLHGEGTPYYTPSPKGCFSVDLGYNVEESLPSLVLYSKLTGDKEVLEATLQSMRTHLAFMLPDGGWDNSWGTRNYKWTWWGSRTSDGSQPAYALMADQDPAFYKAALQNTKLLQTCTKDGILYGGPHYASHGVPASLHHTFCHLKALVTILDHGVTVPANAGKIKLPREETNKSHFYTDIQTLLVAKGKFRATITGYDRNYKDFKGGHASGGALSLLWHETAGLIFAASMNEYQLYEAGNMQKDTDAPAVSLTPRIEMEKDGVIYTNINDFSATIQEIKKENSLVVQTTSKLVDKNQQSPTTGEINCEISYHFTDTKLTIHFAQDNTIIGNQVHIILPIISPSTDRTGSAYKSLILDRQAQKIVISSDKDFQRLHPWEHVRMFNFVPGLEAIPLYCGGSKTTIQIKVL